MTVTKTSTELDESVQQIDLAIANSSWSLIQPQSVMMVISQSMASGPAISYGLDHSPKVVRESARQRHWRKRDCKAWS